MVLRVRDISTLLDMTKGSNSPPLAASDASGKIYAEAGGVVERFMAPVLKTGRAQALVGSNPTPSALRKSIANLPSHLYALWPTTLPEIRTRLDWRGT